MLTDLWLRLRSLFRRKTVEAELDDELRFHLASQTEKYMQAGMPHAEARRRARIELGGLEQTKEQCRDARGVRFLETLWQDVRYGARLLRKSPGFTLVAILTLALGIGVNTAIFSVVNAVLLRPLPVKNSGQLVDVYNRLKQKLLFVRNVQLPYSEYEDLALQSTSFSGLLAYHTGLFALEQRDGSQIVRGVLVTGNYFNTLGVKPVLGRAFDAAEVARPEGSWVAVISHAFWRRHFGGDPGVLGKTIDLNGQLFTVIGVAPASFNGLMIAPTPQIWVPLTEESSRTFGDGSLHNREGTSVWVVGRLKPGVTMAGAQAEMATIADRLARQHPNTDNDLAIALFSANRVRILPAVTRTLDGVSLVLMAVVGLVLLIACTNVASMSMARAASRRKEIAVRLAVGAGRWRLVRQLLTESLLLASAGGAAAVAMTVASDRAIIYGLSTLPFFSQIGLTLGLRVDYRVLLFALIAAIVATALFGLAPALEASHTSPSDALKQEGRSGSRRHRLLNALVVVQVAISVVLLVSAVLSLRSAFNAFDVPPGFDPHGVVVAQFQPDAVGYKPAQSATFYKKLMRRVEALPRVAGAGFASALPLTFSVHLTGVLPADRASATRGKEWPEIDNSEVGPGYFRTLRIPILRGRPFSRRDTASAPLVAIVNQAFARRFWPGEDPVGKRLRIGSGKKDYEVIGVVATGKYRTLGENPRPFVYRSILQVKNSIGVLVVRSSGSSAALLAAIRRAGRQIDPKVPVLLLKTMTQTTAMTLLLPKLAADFFGSAGLLALLLACVGIYGVVSYLVSRRTREIGIRIALGAQRGDVARLVVGRSLVLTLLGVGIGLGCAFAVTRVLSGILYGISATDPVTFIGVPLLLVLVALAACLVPTRRAVQLDPVDTLRQE